MVHAGNTPRWRHHMRKFIVFGIALAAAMMAFKFVFEQGDKLTENLWEKINQKFGRV